MLTPLPGRFESFSSPWAPPAPVGLGKQRSRNRCSILRDSKTKRGSPIVTRRQLVGEKKGFTGVPTKTPVNNWRFPCHPGSSRVGPLSSIDQGAAQKDELGEEYVSIEKKNEEEAILDRNALEEANRAKASFHVATFLTLLLLGIIVAALTLFFTSNMGFKTAVLKMWGRLLKSEAAKQTLAIVITMFFVRSGLTPLVKIVRSCFKLKNPWETSTEAYLLGEIYQPLELLLGVAACATLAENILPPLIAVPRSMIHHVVTTILSLTFIGSAGRVGFTVKKRILQEAKWKMELKGNTSEQRRLEAIDKLSSVGILVVTIVLGLQAVGLDINSLLAIGGIGGIAIGLAGREIFENVFNGFLLMGARPFDVGDEVLFHPDGKLVEGIVLDIGWYNTMIRSFEREVFVIPNSVFSKEVVLNITRKGREWRFLETIPIRVCDVDKVEAIVSDMRRVIRQDEKVIQKLYRRVFLHKITREYISIFIAFYLDMTNRDAFLAARQQMYLAFVDCIDRNGAQVAEKKLIVDFDRKVTGGMLPSGNVNETGNPEPGRGMEFSEAMENTPSPLVSKPSDITDLVVGQSLKTDASLYDSNGFAVTASFEDSSSSFSDRSGHHGGSSFPHGAFHEPSFDDHPPTTFNKG